MSLKDYSAERIGKVWGEDDHLYLVLQLRKIDELARAIFSTQKRERGEVLPERQRRVVR